MYFLAALAIFVAFFFAVRATHNLSHPPESDHYRDAGTAQVILDGAAGQDAAYRGEPWWYPPLVPSLVAGICRATGASPIVAYARYGAFVNLAAPVAFFLFARALFGPWPAWHSLVAFLFIATWSGPTWGQATYSPWMWPILTTQPLTYLTAASWLRSMQTNRYAWSLATGALLGLTFLAHAAAALILASAFGVLVLAKTVRSPRSPLAADWRRLGIVAFVSLLTVSPFLAPLVVRYGLASVNTVPNRFVGLWGHQVLAAQFTWRTVGALLGILAIWRLRSSDLLRRDAVGLLVTLTVVTGVLFSYAFAVNPLESLGVVLPLPVPAFHFHFYFSAVEALLFGAGVWYGIPLVWQELAARIPMLEASPKRWKVALVSAVPLVLAISQLPAYLRRDDLVLWPAEARAKAEDQVRRDLYDWARGSLGPNDVVLTDNYHGLFSVVAAGRHIVAGEPAMVSPYVDAVQRLRDRDAMLTAVCTGRVTEFATLAAQYGVTYVAALPSREGVGCGVEQMQTSRLPLAYRSGALGIFAASPPTSYVNSK